MGVAFVTGLQGNDPTYRKVDATAKHFAVHSGPEADRHQFDVHPSERDLWETYLPAFEALVKEGKAEEGAALHGPIITLHIMTSPPAHRRVLVHAHPDADSSVQGATMPHDDAEGRGVTLVTPDRLGQHVHVTR
jgi:hypothetical protein